MYRKDICEILVKDVIKNIREAQIGQLFTQSKTALQR